MAKNKTVTNIVSSLVFVIVIALIFFSACFVFKAQCGIDILSKFYKSQPQPTLEPVISPTATETQFSVAYKGTLPCADCPGLDTEIILKKANADSLDGTYIQKETYLERDVNPIITEGTWKTIFSSYKGKQEIILEFNHGSPDNVSYFLKVDDNELKMLDKNKDEIVAPGLNFSLIKIIN